MNLEIDNIKKLIKVLSDNNLSEISIEDKDEKTENKQAITIKRNCTSNIKTVCSTSEDLTVNNNEAQENQEKSNKTEFGTPILSPMTGTFYISSSPQSEPYVKAGDIVSEGQVLCIVEAMKLMNEIEAEVSGRITKICVQDGETVEDGQVLMYIE